MQLRIYLAGPITFEREGEIVLREDDLRGRQTRLVLAYLLTERRRPVSRTELVALLWPEEAPPAWEAGLSAVVSRLRQATSKLDGISLESTGGGSYRLLLPPETWVDMECALMAIDEAEAALRLGKPKDAFGPATVGVSIARSGFLAEETSPWADAQRAKLKRVLMRSLEALTEVWLAQGQPHIAVETASDLVTAEALYERGYQLLMRAHAETGHPAEALLAYHRLQELLRARLGTDPSADTQRLYETLLA